MPETLARQRRIQIFEDRAAAGLELARLVREQAAPPPTLVLGLPRGGVPIAYAIAREIKAPLDVLVVRKLGHPLQPELAIGAIASPDIVVRPLEVEKFMPVSERAFADILTRERQELARRESAYRAGRPPLDYKGQVVVVADDGIATGSTMLAAVRALRQGGAARIVVAAPVASIEATVTLRAAADQVLIVQTPANLNAIGQWYRSFEQLSDEDVRSTLALSTGTEPGPAPVAA